MGASRRKKCLFILNMDVLESHTQHLESARNWINGNWILTAKSFSAILLNIH